MEEYKAGVSIPEALRSTATCQILASSLQQESLLGTMVRRDSDLSLPLMCKELIRASCGHAGRMVATAGPDGVRVYSFRSNGRLHVVSHNHDVLPPLFAVFVARASEDALSTTIIALSSDFMLMNWTFNHATRELEFVSQQSMNEGRSRETPLVSAHQIPTVPDQLDIGQTTICAVDAAGQLSWWTCEIPSSLYRWRETTSMGTGRLGVLKAASTAARMTALRESTRAVARDGESQIDTYR